MKTPQARYSAIWDPTVVSKFLKTLASAEFLSLKDLTHKLVVFMALVSVQRAQLLHLLDIKNMTRHKSSITSSLSLPLKQSRPGVSNPVLEFKAYGPDGAYALLCHLHQRIPQDN